MYVHDAVCSYDLYVHKTEGLCVGNKTATSQVAVFASVCLTYWETSFIVPAFSGHSTRITS